MPYSSETKIIDANNVDVLYTSGDDATTARSKTSTVLDKTRTNAWWDNMMDNNSVVSECMERKLQTASAYH
jgi:hypothetical protein